MNADDPDFEMRPARVIDGRTRPAGAVRRTGSRAALVHSAAGERDRGLPGAGRMDLRRAWPAVPLLGALLGACAERDAPRTADAGRPMRIVSLDYCADQYVLKLADREQILAVSPDAPKDFSYMREAARGLRTARPVAEDVLLLQPDLVARLYGGGPNATAFFRRAGVPVLQLGRPPDASGGELDAIPDIIRRAADALGRPERGAALAAEFRARLDALSPRAAGKTALYATPAGATTGPGSLVHEMLLAAGLENFQRRPGWRPLPLERLAYERPDLVAAAFFDSAAGPVNHWSAARHPVARRRLAEADAVPLRGAWTACGGWFVLDAVEALAAGAAR